MENLSMRLKTLRQGRNLSQIDFAKELGISPRNYQRYEYGQREPSASTLIDFVKFYNVSADYLLRLSDNPTRL